MTLEDGSASRGEGPSELRELLGQLGWLPQVRLGALWTAAAGRGIAEHTRVAGRTAEALRVECSSPGWREQVSALEQELLGRLNELGLTGLLRLELSVRAAPPEQTSNKLQPHLPPERLEQIETELRDVKSPAVRQALERLMLTRARSGVPEPEDGSTP